MRIVSSVNFDILLNDLYVTLARVLVSSLLAWLLGLCFALLLKRVRLLEHLFIHPINFIKQISPFAWMPVSIMLFGLGEYSIAMVMLISMLLPGILLSLDMFRTLPKEIIEEAHSAGAHGASLIWHIELPLCASALIHQYRFLWTIGWNTVIAAEMLGVSQGLGFRLLDYRYLLAYKEMMIYILIIGLVGIISDYWLRRFAQNFEI